MARRWAAVVLDLSNLNSLDEDGLRALLDAGEDLARAGKELTVVGARGDVMAAIRPFDRQSSTEDLATGPSLRVERRGVKQE